MTSRADSGKRLDKQTILHEIRSRKPSIVKYTASIPFSAQQAKSETDGPPQPSAHLVRTCLSAAISNTAQLQAIVANATADLSHGQPVKYSMSVVEDVPCEWIGHRPETEPPAARPVSAQDQYNAMTKDTSNKTVILFTAGGAASANNAVLHRPILTELARATGGRVLNVLKRLAPQHPYPAGLLDLLLAYLHLLYPPPGSFHDPIPASRIVLAGNSHGASVCLSLVLTILHFNGRSSNPDGSSANPFSHSPAPTLDFAHYERRLALPAGVLVLSPAPDIFPALPSFWKNMDHDVFSWATHPAMSPSFPADHLWPSDPPREHPYCFKEMLSHPLISPNMAPSSCWQGCPPIYVDIGTDECYKDGALLLVDTMRSAGVPVMFDEFEAMPHDFFMFFPKWWQSKKLIERAAEAVKGMVQPGKKAASTTSNDLWGVWSIEGHYTSKDWKSLKAMDWQYATKIIRNKAQPLKPWTGSSNGKSKM
ncbi:Alpha/Beta hydrolase protein [Elsinoe ampelina]|uniref:Alpha/Beta hydrolase protein n=1 Tax=Elsinoe ampelina TaxID=302913 RepID=A0A6A6G4P7_9PEZI|nr:Alpha/Beta hydrolase protein [Elsinoe ampelina]